MTETRQPPSPPPVSAISSSALFLSLRPPTAALWQCCASRPPPFTPKVFLERHKLPEPGEEGGGRRFDTETIFGPYVETWVECSLRQLQERCHRLEQGAAEREDEGGALSGGPKCAPLVPEMLVALEVSSPPTPGSANGSGMLLLFLPLMFCLSPRALACRPEGSVASSAPPPPPCPHPLRVLLPGVLRGSAWPRKIPRFREAETQPVQAECRKYSAVLEMLPLSGVLLEKMATDLLKEVLVAVSSACGARSRCGSPADAVPKPQGASARPPLAHSVCWQGEQEGGRGAS